MHYFELLSVELLKLIMKRCVIFMQYLKLDVEVKLSNWLRLSFFGYEKFHKKNCSSVVRNIFVEQHFELVFLLANRELFSNQYTCNVLKVITFQHSVNYKV